MMSQEIPCWLWRILIDLFHEDAESINTYRENGIEIIASIYLPSLSIEMIQWLLLSKPMAFFWVCKLFCFKHKTIWN